MKINNLLLAATGMFLLAGCQNTSTPTSTPSETPSTSEEPTPSYPASDPDSTPINYISPAGAPALAFYDKGADTNYTTNSTPQNVAAELQKDEYDIVIFDSISGLTSVRNNNGDYKLAQIITGGNFYLAGIGEENATKLPDADDYVVSFGQGLIPDLVWTTLCNEYWNIDITTHYSGAGVDTARAVLMEGTHEGNAVDYVFIAQPALFAVMSNSSAATYGNVHVVKNIREEWKAYSGQDGIPQAGIFVHNDALSNKHNQLVQWFADLDTRITTAITDPASVKTTMDAYGTVTEQASRFGFNSNVMLNVQKDGANGFGLVSPDETISVNDFITKLNNSAYTTFDDSYFATI